MGIMVRCPEFSRTDADVQCAGVEGHAGPHSWESQTTEKADKHPPPWKWGDGLEDANGERIMTEAQYLGYSEDYPADALAMEQIRAAPEMEALLVKHQWHGGEEFMMCPECEQEEHQGHLPDCAVAVLLARLDAARAGTGKEPG